jgi:hypothetical protein
VAVAWRYGGGVAVGNPSHSQLKRGRGEKGTRLLFTIVWKAYKITIIKLSYFLFFADTAATTSSTTTRPHRAHEPKQRKARIEDGERLLRANGRR